MEQDDRHRSLPGEKDRIMLGSAAKRGAGAARAGITLVELLVVITIIGILIALPLPAVQAAREAARQLQCKNNIKQLALGCLNHEHVQGFLPTNGWTTFFEGDPDRGFSIHQPGGWVYNILPYIEQPAMHDLGAGQSFTTKMTTFTLREATPLAVLICPTCERWPSSRMRTRWATRRCGT